MSFLSGNFCSKLHYFLCTSKKSHQKSIRKNPIVNQNFRKKPSNDQISSTRKIRNVIIHRKNRFERIGLTLSYGLKPNNDIQIFIEEIDRNVCQGNIEVGDEIIRINNHRIRTRDQAIQLICQSSTVYFQIIPNQIPIESTTTEDDSGIILTCENHPQNHLSSLPDLSSKKIYRKRFSRRCLSLDDLSEMIFINEQLANCQQSMDSRSLFDISTDNEGGILKPLPFEQFPRDFKREKHRPRKSSQLKRRNQHRSFRKTSMNFVQEDFYLLNRIFLRENLDEFVEKPYLAMKYQQQSSIEKRKLKKFIRNYSFYYPFSSRSTTNISIDNCSFHSTNIFI